VGTPTGELVERVGGGCRSISPTKSSSRVNSRREGFVATPAEVREVLVEKVGNLLGFTEHPEATEYPQSVRYRPELDHQPGPHQPVSPDDQERPWGWTSRCEAGRQRQTLRHATFPPNFDDAAHPARGRGVGRPRRL
jgi:hypothetical protein